MKDDKQFGLVPLRREGVWQDWETGRELTAEEAAAAEAARDSDDSDTITFASGRSIYANQGIVGISPDLKLSEGYDGSIPWPPWPDDDPRRLTVDDMRELSDRMIERWSRFKDSL